MRNFFRLKRTRYLVFLMLLPMLTLALVGCGSVGEEPGASEASQNNGSKVSETTVKEKPKIVVASKNFTEQFIIGEMMAQLLENAGFEVDRKFGLGGSLTLHQAMVNGEIDIYAEYTGTGLKAILKKEVITDPQKVYNLVKEEYKEKWNLVWLKPVGFNNTYCLTIKKSLKEELDIETYSDLARVSDQLIFGATQEFIIRPGGFQGLKETYGMDFKSTKALDPCLMYDAINQGQVDVISGFATDGRILVYDLVNLEDDKNFFPPYYIAPVVRGELLEEWPVIGEILNKLADQIDDITMQELNYQMDKKGKNEEEIAETFLKEKGLIE